MATGFCSFCGKPLPATGTFCPSCGAAIPGRGSPPPPPPAYPGAYAAPYPPPVVPNPMSARADLKALTLVQIAAILGLVWAVIWIGITFSGVLTGLVTVTTSSSGSVLTLPSPWIFVGLIVAGGIVSLVELYLLRSGFRELVPHDPRFPTPATLALVAMIGVVIVLAASGLLVDALYRAVACAGPGNPLTRSCLPLSELTTGGALVAVGGIVAFIGYIGVLIGLWRLGTRFDEVVFKIGAVLLIFPLLDLVGAILILVGCLTTRQKVAGPAGPPIPPWAGPP